MPDLDALMAEALAGVPLAESRLRGAVALALDVDPCDVTVTVAPPCPDVATLRIEVRK